jgi:GNAT superfamily N-acetyltransferase
VTLPPGQTPAQALADLMGPQSPVPAAGEPAPTASEIRVEGIAKHLAEDKGINVDDLATVAEKPAALEQLDKLREALGIDGAVIGHELPKIIDRVKQLRGEPPAPVTAAEGAPAGEAAPATLRDLMQPKAAEPRKLPSDATFTFKPDPEDAGTWNVKATRGNESIGSMDLIERPNDLEVDLSHLLPAYRGQGYGKAMYQEALKKAQELGKRRLISGSEFTEDAARVWRSLGGEEFTDAHGEKRWSLPVTAEAPAAAPRKPRSKPTR